MEQANDIPQIRADIGALQRQMRQLLEALAVMRQAAAQPAPTLTQPAMVPTAPGTAQAPLQQETHRLLETVRSQAEEVGMLRERVRQLEHARDLAADASNPEEQAHTLRILLRALRDDAAR